MPAGTPRTVSLPPENMKKLGEEMVQWISENKDVLHLSEWYTIEKMYTYNQWKTFIARPEFIPYYEKALRIVGRKYLDKTSNVDSSIKQRWQRSYFHDLKEIEDLDADQEAERKANALKSDAKATEEARQEVLNAVNANRNEIKQVYMSEKKWIKEAIKRPGALHKALKVKEGEKIPDSKIKKAEHSKNPRLKKEAVLAETLKKMHKK